MQSKIKLLQDRLQSLEEDVEEPIQELERKKKEEASRKGKIQTLKREIEVSTCMCTMYTMCIKISIFTVNWSSCILDFS